MSETQSLEALRRAYDEAVAARSALYEEKNAADGQLRAERARIEDANKPVTPLSRSYGYLGLLGIVGYFLGGVWRMQGRIICGLLGLAIWICVPFAVNAMHRQRRAQALADLEARQQQLDADCKKRLDALDRRIDALRAQEQDRRNALLRVVDDDAMETMLGYLLARHRDSHGYSFYSTYHDRNVAGNRTIHRKYLCFLLPDRISTRFQSGPLDEDRVSGPDLVFAEHGLPELREPDLLQAVADDLFARFQARVNPAQPTNADILEGRLVTVSYSDAVLDEKQHLRGLEIARWVEYDEMG